MHHESSSIPTLTFRECVQGNEGLMAKISGKRLFDRLHF